MPAAVGMPEVAEDTIVGFARVLGLEPQDITFLREHPAELQNAIIGSFDASGSKDGHVLNRLQSYTRHMAKRNSAASSTPASVTAVPCSGGDGASGVEKRYRRELLLSHWKLTAKAEPSQTSLSAMIMPTGKGDDAPKALRSTPPAEAPPPPPRMAAPTLEETGGFGSIPAPPPSAPAKTSPPKSFSALRPTALDEVDGSGSPRGKAGLNADAPEFVPFITQASPASAKQPRTPVSLVKTIAEPEPGSPQRRGLQAGMSSPSAVPQPRTPVSLAATIAAPESPVGRLPAAFLAGPPPPPEAPALSRIKTAPAAPAAPSRDASSTTARSQNPFEYHLHRLLFGMVAKRCPSQMGDEADDTSEAQGVLLTGILSEWTQVFGNDMAALMEKCGYTEVGVLVRAIDGLRIVGDGEEARVVTTRAAFEIGQAVPAPTPASAAPTVASAADPAIQRRRPPPPPPVAPAPVLTPGSAKSGKVLSLDTFVQSPSGKAPIGTSTWGGAMGYPAAPSMSWGQGWDQLAAPSWQASFSGIAYPPPDVPDPPSSSAL